MPDCETNNVISNEFALTRLCAVFSAHRERSRQSYLYGPTRRNRIVISSKAETDKHIHNIAPKAILMDANEDDEEWTTD